MKESLKILVVEDEPADAELAQRALEEGDCHAEVSIAKTLLEAKTYLAGQVPSLALIDFVLPDGSGLDLLPPNIVISPC